MDNIIKEIKDDYAEKFALNAVKDFFKKDNNSSNDILFYKTILSWLSDIKSDSDFINKYFYFNNLKECIYQYDIFPNTMQIGKDENEDLIPICIDDYKKIITDDNYSELSQKAGYSLPESFNNKDNYINDSLKRKIEFFEKFYNEIENISLSVSNKKNKGGNNYGRV